MFDNLFLLAGRVGTAALLFLVVLTGVIAVVVGIAARRRTYDEVVPSSKISRRSVI